MAGTPSDPPTCPHGAAPTRPLAQSGLDRDERAVLAIMRHFFQSFTIPESHGWTRGLTLAHQAYPPDHAPVLWTAALAVVQSMRSARLSGFEYSNPDCAVCARGYSDHERLLMEVVSASRRGQKSRTYTAALLLCEGNDPAGLIAAAGHLARQTALALNTPDRPAGATSP